MLAIISPAKRLRFDGFIKTTKYSIPENLEKSQELIIKEGFMIATSDGNIDDSEIQMINEFGNAMGMSKYHVEAVIAEMLQKN